MTWIQLFLILVLGMTIGLTAGTLGQYWYARRKARHTRLMEWREKWRYRPDAELEDALRRSDAFAPEARQAARKLLSERRRLLS